MKFLIVSDGVEPSAPRLTPVPTRHIFQCSGVRRKKRTIPILLALRDYPASKAPFRTFIEFFVILGYSGVAFTLDKLSESSEAPFERLSDELVS